MFGLLVSGKLPQTNFQRVNEFQFVIQIPDVNNVNHLVVYMTGETPFPDGYGGGVYFNYQVHGESKWIYLGKICNEKPSAIYKIGKLKHEENHIGDHPFNALQLVQAQQTLIDAALIGISVEKLDILNALTASNETQASNLSSFAEFTQKMLENFFNYASSFAITSQENGQQYVPLATLQNWFTIFQRRIEQNPNFWKNL